MVVRTPSLVYIYISLSIVSRNYMNDKLRFFFFLSLSTHLKEHDSSKKSS